MRPKLMLILLVAASAMAAMIVVLQPHRPVTSLPVQTPSETISQPLNSLEGSLTTHPPVELVTRAIAKTPVSAPTAELPGISSTNKLDRLAQIREQFRTLAAGQPETAMRAAKQIYNETERETALLALVTEWTRGNLRFPRERAEDVARFGIEAGLGMELVADPQLAMAWADELTAGAGRQALLTQTAITLTGTDPAAAFAIGEQLPDEQRTNFFNRVWAGWGGKDTDASLQWANQLPDPADREAAIQAIRTEAPVGIGTSLTVKDGYPTVMQLLPGTPAEMSGQIHAGDRILALAQGDNAFINAQGVPLADLVKMIRGLPGTTLQLQVLSADAPAGSPPQTISIVRDQLKFKR